MAIPGRAVIKAFIYMELSMDLILTRYFPVL
jgi:hypothetical protein